VGKRYEKSKKDVSENRQTLERLGEEGKTLREEYAPLSLLDSIQNMLDDEASDAIQEVKSVGDTESQRIETETGTAEEEKREIAGEINSEIAKLNSGLEKLKQANSIEFGRKAVEQSSQEYKRQIDRFKALMGELGEDAIESSGGSAEKASSYIDTFAYEQADDSTGEIESSTKSDGGKTLHLSREEADSRWKQTLQNVDAQIQNYREELISRGVPECSWLNKTLNEHRTAMLNQESHNLEVARGQIVENTNTGILYNYPTDYPQFYNNLADEFRSYCLKGTNPNYSKTDNDSPWNNNCQRCVSAYEARRRGLDVVAQPLPPGNDALPIMRHPNGWPSVYEGACLIDCSANSGTGAAINVENQMEQWGTDARAIVRVRWKAGGGHVFIAERNGGATRFVDPQNGDTDVRSYFDFAKGSEVFCMRIDNLPFTDRINQCCTPIAA
jgi:ElaB/YqjD/DUF883 family membrane-anchored ribosome-binding protein